MHKTICLILLVISIVVSLWSAQPRGEQQLKSALQKIEQLHEANLLMKEIWKEGKITFATNETHSGAKFGAFWDLDGRVIYVNPSFHSNEGEMIGSILFELQNARTSKELMELFDQAERGEVDKATYVRGIEFIEYKNSKRASEMSQVGINRGIFPPSAKLFTYRDFDEHFYYQQLGGHSKEVGALYDHITQKSR